MAEHIYTIEINEQFEKRSGCPICGLKAMLERNEVEIITGAAMMEPSVRIETNRVGFCAKHFDQIITNGKRLPVALMLQSHLEAISAHLDGAKPDAAEKFVSSLEGSCYVCDRLEEKMRSIYANVVYLWSTDETFRKLFREQERICMPHYGKLLAASKSLSKKDRIAFCDELNLLFERYVRGLQGDIDWFCKKFDYRYAKEDWKNSKDAIERTVEMLTSDLPARCREDI